MPDPAFAEKHRNKTFDNSITWELREKAGRLYPLVGMTANYSGAGAHRITNRFDDLVMWEKKTRNGDTQLTDPDSKVRWIKAPRPGEVGVLLDDDDQAVSEVTFGDPLAAAVAKSARMWHDDSWLLGYYGNAWEGENGDVAVPFDTTNTVVSGGTGITKAKLIGLQQAMALKDVDTEEEMPVLLVTPRQVSDLFNITEYVNTDYSESKPLERFELKPWLGFRFRRFNPDSPRAYKRAGALTKSGTTRKLPCFLPSGLHRGVWYEFRGDIGMRRDKGLSEQIYGKARSAVVRTDEAKCFILECNEP